MDFLSSFSFCSFFSFSFQWCSVHVNFHTHTRTHTHRFSQQAMQCGHTSLLPLILAQITTQNRTHTLEQRETEKNTETERETETEIERKIAEVELEHNSFPSHASSSNSQLNDRDVSLPQLGHRLLDKEQNFHSVKKRGIFTARLPTKSSVGILCEFSLNPVAAALLPHVNVAWQCNIWRRDVLILFRCPLSGEVCDVGGVEGRRVESGEPISWRRRS